MTATDVCALSWVDVARHRSYDDGNISLSLAPSHFVPHTVLPYRALSLALAPAGWRRRVNVVEHHSLLYRRWPLQRCRQCCLDGGMTCAHLRFLLYRIADMIGEHDCGRRWRRTYLMVSWRSNEQIRCALNRMATADDVAGDGVVAPDGILLFACMDISPCAPPFWTISLNHHLSPPVYLCARPALASYPAASPPISLLYHRCLTIHQQRHMLTRMTACVPRVAPRVRTCRKRGRKTCLPRNALLR